MVCDTKKPHSSFPKLGCTGAETKQFMKPFLEIIKSMLDPELPEHQNMVEALQALVELVDLFDQADLFLTRAEHSQAVNLGKRFFDHYAELCRFGRLGQE